MIRSVATPALTDVCVIVVGIAPGDVYLAGRTLRALRQCSISAHDVTRLDECSLCTFLEEQAAPIWLLRAGTWPRSPERLRFPPASRASTSVAALGAVFAPADAPTNNDQSAWRKLIEQSGGEIQPQRDLSDLVPLYSCFLSKELVRRLCELLKTRAIPQAIRDSVSSEGVRCIRFAPLDVCWDPRLRVAEVITSLQRGGAERIVIDLSASLIPLDVHPVVITTGRPMRGEFPRPQGTVDVSAHPGGRAGRLSAAAAAARANCVDLVHAHLLTQMDLESFQTARLPVLLTIHNARPGWTAGSETLDFSHAQLLAACSQHVAEDLQSANLQIPIRTAWNGIDVGAYASTPAISQRAQAMRNEWRVTRNDRLLLALANPRAQKRLHLLPAILRSARAHWRQLHTDTANAGDLWLVIAGDAATNNADAQHAEQCLGQEIERCNQGSRIIRLPATNDVAALLHACDVCISVSAWEGLSLAHLEALAAGRPLIATSAGGTPEIAAQCSSATLLPIDVTPEAAADGICKALQVPATECSEGRTKMARNFSRARMAERYVHLFRRVLASAPEGALVRPSAGRGVWLITNNFSTGGAQSSARRLMTEFHRRGIPTRAAVVQEQRSFPTPGRQALEGSGIRVLALPYASGAEATPVDAADAIAELLAQIDCDPPKAVVMWNLIQQYKVLLADALLNTPVFDVSPGEMYFQSLQNYFRQPRPGLPYRSPRDYGKRLAGVIVKYPAEVEIASGLLGAPVHMVPNGVACNETPPLPRRQSGRIVFGTVARLSPQKKLEDLIAAFRQVHARLPPYVLRIAGGPERGSERYAKELQESTMGLNVEWRGESDTTTFLGSLDVFVMISEPAGCPNASLEAMAAGLPVIATDVGGASEQVMDGVSGRLLPRGDTSALANALLSAAFNPACLARWGYAGWQRIRQHFSLELMVKRYAEVLGI
jgi:glycosyltransferase involved in cell wall biosynthesis